MRNLENTDPCAGKGVECEKKVISVITVGVPTCVLILGPRRLAEGRGKKATQQKRGGLSM